MKLHKHFLPLLLCMALLLGALASCGSSSTETEAVETTETESETVQEQTEQVQEMEEEPSEEPETVEEDEVADVAETEEEQSEEVVQEDSQDIAYVEAPLPLSDTPVTFSVFCSGIAPSVQSVLPNGYNDDAALAMNYLEETTGVTIDFQTVDGFVMAEQFNLMIVSGEYPDVISAFSDLYTTGATGGIEDEIILDLNGYTEYLQNYMAVLDAYPEFQSEAYADDGSMPYILGFVDEVVVETGGGIRQDYLDALGLDMPETYDELYEVGMAIKNAYDTSATFYFTSALMPSAAFAGGFDLPAFDITGSDNSFYQVDGQVQCALVSDSMKDYLSMMKQWYDSSLMLNDFYTQQGGSTAEAVIYDGNCAVWWGTLINLTKYNNLAETEGFAAVALPNTLQYEGQTTHFRSVSNVSENANMSITAACDEDMIPVILQYFDYLFTEEGEPLCNYGLEGQSYYIDENGQAQYLESVYSYADGASTFTVLLAPYIPTDGVLPSLYDGDRAVTARYDAINAGSVDLYTNDGSDDAYTLPTLTLTTDENEAISAHLVDCETYAAECLIKFIIGDMDLDADWDAYVAQMDTFGIQEVIAAKQSAYERYISR